MTYNKMLADLHVLAAAMPDARERFLRIERMGGRVDHRIPLTKTTDPRFIGATKMLRDLQRVGDKLDIPIQFVRLMKYRDAVGVHTEDGIIKVRRDRSAKDTPHVAHILAHELTHALWHNDPVAKMPRRDEAEAEAVAYLISHAYECYAMDSPLYLASHLVTTESLYRIATRAIADAQFLIALAKEERP